MQCHRYFLSGSHDSTVTVWDFDTLMPVKNHYNYDSAINDASFSHDSQYLALGGDEYTIKINHTITGEALTMPKHFWVHSAARHPVTTTYVNRALQFLLMSPLKCCMSCSLYISTPYFCPCVKPHLPPSIISSWLVLDHTETSCWWSWLQTLTNEANTPLVSY